MSTKKFVVADPDGSRYLVTISEDVTAEYALGPALQEAIAAANAAKSAFLATMSHEIRTPLNGVLGMAQAMAAEALPPVQAEQLDVVRRSGESLLRILNDIPDLSKIETGKLTLETVDFYLSDIVQTVHAAFTDMAANKCVALSLDMGGAAGVYRGDPKRLRQMLFNLTSNTLKFTTSGKVAISASRQKGRRRIRVRDSGIAMSADMVAQLFNEYTQADSSTTRRFAGAGLELSICKKLADLMGGTIAVDSRPGQGSIFRFGAFPNAPFLCQPLPSAPADDLGQIRILAAEDNPTKQLVLRTSMAQAGIEPTVVDNAAQAVSAWMNGQFDVILMDVQMPVMDGIAATQSIRSREDETGRPRMPIIALTANAMYHQTEQYRAASMDGYVSRPISVAALFAALEAALADDAAAQTP
jgi:CheY-like chemotaxis protein